MNNKSIVKQLREILPPKIDYADLVCAEGFAHGQHYVWDDPEPYIINEAANEIERLQSENTRLKAERDKAVEDLQGITKYNSTLYCHCHDMLRIANKWQGLEEIKR